MREPKRNFSQEIGRTLGTDAHQLVEDLASDHKRKYALRRLMSMQSRATPALRFGLNHESADVRIGCCQVLDHYMDDDAVPELKENLTHPHPGVRSWALHALACDRCKEGSCRPGEADVVPIVIRLLLEDENRHVRQMAAGMLGPSCHRHPDVVPVLLAVLEFEPHPAVRKVASWWVPGGPRFEKTQPRLVQAGG